MIYFQAKSDLAFIIMFKQKLDALFEFENRVPESSAWGYTSPHDEKTRLIREASKHQEYVELRRWIVQNLQEAKRLAYEAGIGITGSSAPPPAVGGLIIPFNVLESIIDDYTHGGVAQHTILDVVDKIIGHLERKVQQEKWKIVNPFYWVKVILMFILSMPLKIVGAAGFDTDTILGSKWSKIFHLFIYLCMLGWLYYVAGYSIEHIMSFITKIVLNKLGLNQ